MVSEWTTSAPESTGSAFSARTRTIARRLETTHSGSYVALSSKGALVGPAEGTGRTGGAGARRGPGCPADDDPGACRGTDHLRSPGTAGGSETRGLPHSDPRTRESGTRDPRGGAAANYRGCDALPRRRPARPRRGSARTLRRRPL